MYPIKLKSSMFYHMNDPCGNTLFWISVDVPLIPIQYRRVKFEDKTRQTATLKSYYICKKKILRIIDFKPQTSPFDRIFKEKKIFNMSGFVNYKHALFVTKSLRREIVVMFNDMFTPLNQNHHHNTRAAINHLLDIAQKQIVTTGLTLWYLQLQNCGMMS